jgi:DNA-directed RNA polymerase subunit RPC12/RpoP
MYRSFESSNERRFEELIRDGITAAKNGQKVLARSLLERAVQLKVGDARPWMWLSTLTEDPDERRRYLEYAVAAEPHNETARRELVLLSDQLDRSRLVPEGESVAPLRPSEPEEAVGQSFLCSQCGGRMHFNPGLSALVCSYCGSSQAVESAPAADAAEQVIDFVLPTTRAHRWAEARKRVVCESCGAIALLDPSHLSGRCSYCASNQLIESSEAVELVEPQAIGLARVDANTARRQVKEWLGKGFFAPDNLMRDAGGFDMRLAYYPFWTFDGIFELPWTCEVNEGSSKNPHWVARSGSEFEIYDDVLVPGTSILENTEIEALAPFNLKDVIDLKPEHLAGWPALSYDRPLSDASLLAREAVTSRVRRRLGASIEPGRDKRAIRSSSGRWSGGTFKNVLLPLWVGTYSFHGKPYHLLVNGQTGKVAGAKPRDDLKVAMVVLGGLLLLVLLGMRLSWLVANYAVP